MLKFCKHTDSQLPEIKQSVHTHTYTYTKGLRGKEITCLGLNFQIGKRESQASFLRLEGFPRLLLALSVVEVSPPSACTSPS